MICKTFLGGHGNDSSFKWCEIMSVNYREACKYIQENLTINVEELGKESIVSVAKTSMSSKLIGQVDRKSVV